MFDIGDTGTIKTIPALMVLTVKCGTGLEMEDYNPVPKLVEKCLPTEVFFIWGDY